MLLALKAPSVAIVKAFTPFVANVKALPNKVALELISPTRLN